MAKSAKPQGVKHQNSYGKISTNDRAPRRSKTEIRRMSDFARVREDSNLIRLGTFVP